MDAVERRWSFRRCVETHQVLDALEDAEFEAHARAKREAEHAQSAAWYRR